MVVWPVFTTADDGSCRIVNVSSGPALILCDGPLNGTLSTTGVELLIRRRIVYVSSAAPTDDKDAGNQPVIAVSKRLNSCALLLGRSSQPMPHRAGVAAPLQPTDKRQPLAADIHLTWHTDMFAQMQSSCTLYRFKEELGEMALSFDPTAPIPTQIRGAVKNLWCNVSINGATIPRGLKIVSLVIRLHRDQVLSPWREVAAGEGCWSGWRGIERRET